jgi:hypothetical protein
MEKTFLKKIGRQPVYQKIKIASTSLGHRILADYSEGKNVWLHRIFFPFPQKK